MVATGCSSGQASHDRGFFTSGSREADQRDDQHMANNEQLQDTDHKPVLGSDTQKALYDRLGGDTGVKVIVDEFVTRLLADPHVNFRRKASPRAASAFIAGNRSKWTANDANIEQLKKHFRQFLALSTGGPSFYDGKEITQSHAGMHITNAEFDAAVGDLKATLDKIKIADKEQRELLAIIESTRTQIVEDAERHDHKSFIVIQNAVMLLWPAGQPVERTSTYSFLTSQDSNYFSGESYESRAVIRRES